MWRLEHLSLAFFAPAASVSATTLSDDEYQAMNTSDLAIEQTNITVEERYGDLDLDYYRAQINPDQFELLLGFAGVHLAPPDSDPNNLFYP